MEDTHKSASEELSVRRFKFIAVKRRPKSWPLNNGCNPYLNLFHAPDETEVKFWLNGKEELDKMTSNAATIAAMKKQADLGETAGPPPPAEKPAANSLEDDVHRLAEELAKNPPISFSDARKVAKKILGSNNGESAFNELKRRLEGSASGEDQCYGLKRIKDPQTPAKKWIVKNEG